MSVTIRSGDVIDSIEFSYADHDGSEQVVGPWGGPGGNAYKVSGRIYIFFQSVCHRYILSLFLDI